MPPFFCNVLITGSNRGIGLEFVKQFLSLPQPPQHLFATCRSANPEHAAELFQLAKENSNLHVLKLDVTDEDHIRNVACEVGKMVQDQGLNLLINNAAIFSFGEADLTKVTAKRMMETYQTNTVGPLMIVQALLPLLKRAGAKSSDSDGSCNAAIVNISSRPSSISENKIGGMYAARATKTATNIITKSLSIDLKADGIVAVLVDPGWVKTEAGGENAEITPQESITGMLQVILSLDDSKSGRFYNYRGEIVPW